MERGSVTGDYYEANRMKAFEEAASCSSSIRWLKFNFMGESWSVPTLSLELGANDFGVVLIAGSAAMMGVAET